MSKRCPYTLLIYQWKAAQLSATRWQFGQTDREGEREGEREGGGGDREKGREGRERSNGPSQAAKRVFNSNRIRCATRRRHRRRRRRCDCIITQATPPLPGCPAARLPPLCATPPRTVPPAAIIAVATAAAAPILFSVKRSIHCGNYVQW